MKRSRRIALGILVLVGAVLIGVAGWGYARPAAASADSETHYGSTRSGEDRHAGDTRKHNREEGSRQAKSENRHVRQESDRHLDYDDEDDEATAEPTLGQTATTLHLVTSPTTPPTTAAPATTTTAPRTTTTAAPNTTTTAPRTTTTAAPNTTTTSAINAAALFSANCSRSGCHGTGGVRIGSSLTSAQILSRISSGGSMSSYASSLSSAQRSALADYVAATY